MADAARIARIVLVNCASSMSADTRRVTPSTTSSIFPGFAVATTPLWATWRTCRLWLDDERRKHRFLHRLGRQSQHPGLQLLPPIIDLPARHLVPTRYIGNPNARRNKLSAAIRRPFCSHFEDRRPERSSSISILPAKPSVEPSKETSIEPSNPVSSRQKHSHKQHHSGRRGSAKRLRSVTIASDHARPRRSPMHYFLLSMYK